MLKNRANVVYTDNLRENANMNWMEVTKFCVKNCFLRTDLSQL